MNRREFLAVSAAGLPTLALAAPVPGIAPPIPLPRASDAPPPLPVGAFARLGSRRFRTSKGISRIQFDPTGRVIVAADRDEIRGWEVATAQPIFSMPYPEKVSLNSGRISSVNTIVALGRVDSNNHYEIHHYKFATGKTEIFAKTPVTNVEQAAFSSDGSLVAVSNANRLCVYDGTTGSQLYVIGVTASNRDNDLQFLPGDGALLVSGNDGIKLFDARTGKERGELKTEKTPPKKAAGRGRSTAEVGNIVASRDGTLLAGRWNLDKSQMLIWNAGECKLLQSFKTGDSETPLGFTADNRELIVESDGGLIFYTVVTGAKARTLDIGASRAQQLSPAADYVASSAEDAVLLFSTATGALHPLSADPPGLPHRLTYVTPTTLRGQFTAFGGWVEWSLPAAKGTILRVSNAGPGVPVGLAGDGTTAATFHDRKVTLWNLASRTKVRTLDIDEGRSVPHADLSRDSRWIIANEGTGVAFHDTTTGQRTFVKASPMKGSRDAIDQFAASVDGEFAAVSMHHEQDDFRGGGSRSKSTVEIYSRTAGAMLHRVALVGQVVRLDFSPDGSRLAVSLQHPRDWRTSDSHESRHVTVYDVLTGRGLFAMPKANGGTHITALSADNRLLVSELAEGTVDIWEILSGRKRMSFSHKTTTSALAVAPDGKSFASAGPGGPVLLWHLRGQHFGTPAKPAVNTLAKLVETLSQPDAEPAFAALRTIAAWPNETLPELRNRIEPIKGPDTAKLTQLTGDLDAPAFRTREAATRELQALGELALPALRRVLATTDSDEVRTRAEDLIAQIDIATAGNLLALRAVEAAEWADGEAAKAALTHWASGAAGARLTREATAALKRLTV